MKHKNKQSSAPFQAGYHCCLAFCALLAAFFAVMAPGMVLAAGPPALDTTALPHAAANDVAIKNLLDDALVILGLLAVVMLVVGGIRYSASQGNPDQIEKAKNTIIYSIVGVVIAVSAFAIVSVVSGYVAPQ